MLIPPRLKHEINSKFRQIKKDLAKCVTVFLKPGSTKSVDCPNCLSAGGTSAGIVDSSFVIPVTIYGILISPISFTRGRCPVCQGAGILINTEAINNDIYVLVRWNPTGTESRGVIDVTAAGYEGSNIVQIKADKCNYENIRDCDYILIDGVKCDLVAPPVLRSVGDKDIAVIAYLKSTETGGSVRE